MKGGREDWGKGNRAGSQEAPVIDLTIVIELFALSIRSQRLRIAFVFLKTNE